MPPPTFASKLLPRLDKIRGIAGRLGLHPFAFYIRANAWTGGRPGVGTLTSTTTRIYVDGNQNPKVKAVSDKDAMLSGGLYTNQDMRVGPLTPPFNLGGIAYATLDPPVASGTEFFFKLVGPGEPAVGQWFTRLNDDSDSALHIYIVLRATGATPPGGP
jgi:hypothetical protein